MRLTRLDLERYGAFEGRSIALRPDARVHVVYGANEAGKTTALAAVSDLLFGFEHKTDFAFRFETKELRLGGAVSAADGRSVAFRRRKGKSPTLLDADDQPLRDDLLAPFLGGLTRELFGRAFGLAARELRAGGEELLAAESDADMSLFAAASGLRGLEDLRKGLEADADAIFAPRASKDRRFYQAQARYEAARAAARQSALLAGDWKALNARIEELSATYDDFAARRRAAVEARARLERLKRAAVAMSEVDAADAELAALAPLPEISAAAIAELDRRLALRDAAEGDRRRAAAAVETAEHALAQVSLDEAALARAADIETLFAATGADAKARLDLPGVEREAAQYDAELASLVSRLGLADAQAIERGQPTDAASAALKELIAEGRALSDTHRARTRDLATERDGLADLITARGDTAPVDPRPLREAYLALGSALKPLERLDELRRDHGRERAALDEAALRLQPSVKDLDALAAAPLPQAETVDRAAKELDRADDAVSRGEHDLGAAQAEAADVESEIEGLAAGRPIASPDAIAGARAERDGAWRDIRELAQSGEALPAAQAQAFEAAVRRADGLADDAAADAGRIARHAELGRRAGAAARRVEEAKARLSAAREKRAALGEDFLALWSAAGVEPGRPDTMAAWCGAVASLLQRREKNAALSAEIVRLEEADRRLAPHVARIAEGAGLDVSGLAAIDAASRLEARLRILGDAFEAGARAQAGIAETTRRIERLERAAGAAETEQAGWKARWAAALPGFGLGPDVTPGAAEAALGAWDRAPDILRERANRVRRVEGMRRDVDRFAKEAAALVADLAPELTDENPDAAARRLNDRLARARSAEAGRALAAERLAEARAQLEDAARVDEAAQAALAEAASAFPAGADLRETLDLLKARAALQERVADRRRALAQTSEGVAEGDLREDLSTFEPDEAAGAIAGFEEQERRLDLETQRAFADLSDATRQRDDRASGEGAEAAAAEQRSAEAELATTARDWAVLKIGATLVSEAVARHRAARQNPLLVRAGALFATLTGETFSGLAESYDDDTTKLFARRASGDLVPIGGLSEGTRDQFYLALRLAFLEDFSTRAEPAPFIGDDLFSSFDDARTGFGLRALAEIGAAVQPILFTHHRAVVETAQRTLGESVDVVEI